MRQWGVCAGMSDLRSAGWRRTFRLSAICAIGVVFAFFTDHHSSARNLAAVCLFKCTARTGRTLHRMDVCSILLKHPNDAVD